VHGFGGPSQFWDYNLESFTLMAGWRRLQPHQALRDLRRADRPAAVAARMAVTIDSISHGRFGSTSFPAGSGQ